MMRTNIELNRCATAGLQTEIAVLRQKKQTQQAMLIATEGALKVSVDVFRAFITVCNFCVFVLSLLLEPSFPYLSLF